MKLSDVSGAAQEWAEYSWEIWHDILNQHRDHDTMEGFWIYTGRLIFWCDSGGCRVDPQSLAIFEWWVTRWMNAIGEGSVEERIHEPLSTFDGLLPVDRLFEFYVASIQTVRRIEEAAEYELTGEIQRWTDWMPKKQMCKELGDSESSISASQFRKLVKSGRLIIEETNGNRRAKRCRARLDTFNACKAHSKPH